MRLVIPFLIAALAHASDIRVSDVRLDPEQSRINLSLRWDNGWRSERNHDAAWVFVKIIHDRGWSRHVRLGMAHGIRSTSPGGLEVITPLDRTGVFVRPTHTHRGAVSCDLILGMDMPDDIRWDEFRVEAFAIEMVYVPQGAFWIGDAHPDAQAHAAFASLDENGAPAGPFHVTSERAIDVGDEPGDLWYDPSQAPQYRGDRVGPIPAAFPKGFNDFYVMKYEISQGEYAAFLNTLYSQATSFRAIHGGVGYARDRGTISLQGDAYVAARPRRPANFVSWADGCAFADWAGLRPMTELEFTKACRGPDAPTPRDYPWGTDSSERLLRVVDEQGDLLTEGMADESNLSDATRDQLGASHWWVMDLAGSLWERCITVGHPLGRAFEGTHGDGRLTPYGHATNEDWPLADEGVGGYGYRGGGFYGYDQSYEPGHFNPWSPVAFRPYASWGDAPRSEAYGFRAVRTAP